MSRRRITILEDPRYDEFVERYHADPLRFAVEVCGMEPSEDQEALFDSLIDPTAKVSVASGTGTGKTAGFGRIALWHMLCHPVAFYEGKVEIGSNTYIGAPRISQVADGVWKELQDVKLAIGNGPVAWIAQYFTITKTRVVVNGFEDQWFIAQVAMQQGKAVGIAGKHRYWQLIIIDEAAGVPDEHFNVIDGTQTQGGNRTVMASQGVRNAGRFYDSHHSLNADNGGSWTSLTFSSENSPFVTLKWLKDREKECGGRDTAEFQIRVLGRFADNSDKYLLSRGAIERLVNPKVRAIVDDEPYGNFLVIDVAAGVFRDKTVGTHMRVTGNGDRLEPNPRRIDIIDIPIFTNTLDWQDVAGMAHNIAAGLSNCTVLVDVGGQGVQFAKMLEKLGTPNVIKVNWGNTNFLDRLKKRFVNQRAQCSVNAADAVKDGRITFCEKYKKELLDQGSRIPFFFDEKGRWQIMSKVDMKQKEGIPSPDLWDTICMAFLEDAHYITDESSGQYSADNRIKTAREAADEEFADA